LTELLLSHNRISEIPETLTALKSLKRLELHNNPIREILVSLSMAMDSCNLDGTIDSFALTFPNISCPSFSLFSEIPGQSNYTLREIFTCVCCIARKTENHLTMPSLGITASPHANVFNKQQTVLNLSNNMISDFEASVFTTACCLTEIDLSRNNLSNSLALGNVTSLIQLKRMNVSGNQLCNYVLHYSNVVSIDLSFNNIKVIPIAAFTSSWASLIHADFSCNPLCQIGNPSCKSDVNRWHEMVFQDQECFASNQLPLETINLKNTGLFGSIPVVFARLRALKKLNASDTYIADLPPLFWRIFEDLTPETANFSNCPFSHLSIQIFESFFLNQVVELTELDIRRQILQYGLPRGFRASQILDCCGAALTSLHLECSNLELTDLPKPCLIKTLTIMDISCNHLLHLPPEVYEMVNLKSLNIAKNDFVVLSENISKLRKLECLDIYDTNITELPYSLALMPFLELVTWQPTELTRFEIQKMRLDDGMLPQRVPPAAVFFGGWSYAKMFMIQIINSQKSHSLEISGINLPSLPRELARSEFSSNIWELTVSKCITEELPGWMSRFTALTHLDLSDNKLSRLPDNFGVLTSINHLDLSSNPLKETFPALSALINLEFLNLCKTQTESLHPSISKLLRLKTFALQHTKLSVIPDFVSNLVSLEMLLLDSCCITSIAWAVGRCPKLRELQCKSSAHVIETPHKHYVSLGSAELLVYMKLLCRAEETGDLCIMHTDLESFPEEITEIVHLKTLTLLGIKAKRILPSIGYLIKLEELNFGQNVLAYVPNEIGQLLNLIDLDLSSNLLSALPVSLSNCKRLISLHLSSNKFQDWPPCIFELLSIQTLSFSNNRLELVPEGISKLTTLKQLFLQQNALLTVSRAVGYLASLETVDLSHNSLSTITVYFGACPHLRRIRRVDLPLLEVKLARMRELSDGDFIKELRFLYSDLMRNTAMAESSAAS
jgi:Leucine-rich repeat (LRR) protein